MKMMLVIDRLDKNGRIVQRIERPSRSFVKGFMEMLYTAHIQATYTVPATSMSTDMVTVNSDVSNASIAASYIGNTGLMKLGSMPGGRLNRVWGTDIFAGAIRPNQFQNTGLPGEDIGIQIGADATAVTPLDRRLGQRFGHGVRPPDGAETLFDSYAVGEDTSFDMSGAAIWAAQPFVPQISHRVTSVSLKIYKEASPGNLTVSIRGGANSTASQAMPPLSAYCADLATGTILEADIPAASPGALTKCTFATPADLYAGHRYFIVARALGAGGANHAYWRYDTAGATYERAPRDSSASVFTCRDTSTNSGVSWTETGSTAFIFEENGQSIGEFEIGGCELGDLIIADPNASFSIRRYFTNNSGGDLVVNEAGLVCPANSIFAQTGNDGQVPKSYPILIARDLTGAITVHDTEILRVTYTPGITV